MLIMRRASCLIRISLLTLQDVTSAPLQIYIH